MISHQFTSVILRHPLLIVGAEVCWLLNRFVLGSLPDGSMLIGRAAMAVDCLH